MFRCLSFLFSRATFRYTTFRYTTFRYTTSVPFRLPVISTVGSSYDMLVRYSGLYARA